ncbi:MAG: P1 family peptidase [Nitrospinota bacterium]
MPSPSPSSSPNLSDVPGVRLGHAEDLDALTGCTVLLFEKGAVAGLDLRGTATGTRQMDALRPLHVVGRIDAVLFAGGSAFGLDAAAGVMSYLEEMGVGFPTRETRVPIVPAAILYDLALGSSAVRPTPEMARQACEAANGPQGNSALEGSVGAGAGASVGKLFGPKRAMKAGVGTWSVRSPQGATVGALAVVNAFGDVVCVKTGRILAGARTAEDSVELADTAEMMRRGVSRSGLDVENTTLCCVATDARLDRAGAEKLAQMAAGGLVRTLRPAFSTFDGDLVIAASTGQLEEDLNVLGILAEEALAFSINRAVTETEALGGLPAARDLDRM